MSENHQPPSGVSGPIGLALSGGGTRAAAFHLGTLACLDHVGLISQLRILSTVSGGTFTGAKYIWSLVQGKSFQQFFKEFYAALRDTDFIKDAVEELTDGEVRVPSNRENPIVSVAQVYDEILFRGKDAKSARFGDILDADIPIDEIIFNTTEFIHGINFRFQKSADPRAKIGNYYMDIPLEASKEIRLADIVAASSCIPAGFEPIIFPDDFAWPGNKVPPEIQEQGCFENPVPIMDGGIYDNLGIDALMLAERRINKDMNSTWLDMIISSDVFQDEIPIHEYPEDIDASSLRLRSIQWIIWGIGAAAAISAAALAIAGIKQMHNHGFKFFPDFFLYGFPFLLSSALAGAVVWSHFKFEQLKANLKKSVPQLSEAVWNRIGRITFRQMLNILNRRVKSLVDLTSSIFMTRIRQLTRNDLYAEERYLKRRISNLIYDLKPGRPFSKKLTHMQQVAKPSDKLRHVAHIAVNVPTAMWFGEPHQLPCLVAAGQATICYNLMIHVVGGFGEDIDEYPDDVKRLWDKLVKDWNELVEDPYALLHEILPGEDLPALK
jgi:predicted acylesterase/phospholipase RssA